MERILDSLDDETRDSRLEVGSLNEFETCSRSILVALLLRVSDDDCAPEFGFVGISR